MSSGFRIVVSCEHAVNTVPDAFAFLFKRCRMTLRGHRGYDIGAVELAGLLAEHFGASSFSSEITRLVVDLNRSPGHPELFSEFTRQLNDLEKEGIMQGYYLPWRRSVEGEIGRICDRGQRVLHLSVHSFTPELQGKVRVTDIGLLYDPSRAGERFFCGKWKGRLKERDPSLKVRLNYPYSGKSDGFTTYLRSVYNGKMYLGIELEVSQKFALGKKERWRDVQQAIVDSLASTSEDVRWDPTAG